MEPTRDQSPDDHHGVRPVLLGGTVPHTTPTPSHTAAPGGVSFAPTLHDAKALNEHDIMAPWRDHWVWLHHCGLPDAPALQDWTDAALRGDYWFRKGHWISLLNKPTVSVFAAATAAAPESPRWACGAIAIVYASTRLLNLYVAPDLRQLGLGTRILELLSPTEIRAKTDMSAGDPTPFYTRLGYTIQSTGEGPHGNISIMRRNDPSTPAWLTTNGK